MLPQSLSAQGYGAISQYQGYGDGIAYISQRTTACSPERLISRKHERECFSSWAGLPPLWLEIVVVVGVGWNYLSPPLQAEDETLNAQRQVETTPDSSAVRIGQNVTAIGYPLAGNFAKFAGGDSLVQNLVKMDALSTFGRIGGRRIYKEVSCFHLGGDINSGNSGGPLVDRLGRVIGINTWSVSGAAGLSFAIEINEVLPFIKANLPRGVTIEVVPF